MYPSENPYTQFSIFFISHVSLKKPVHVILCFLSSRMYPSKIPYTSFCAFSHLACIPQKSRTRHFVLSLILRVSLQNPYTQFRTLLPYACLQSKLPYMPPRNRNLYDSDRSSKIRRNLSNSSRAFLLRSLCQSSPDRADTSMPCIPSSIRSWCPWYCRSGHPRRTDDRNP